MVFPVRSFRTRVTVAMVLSMLFMIALSDLVISEFSLKAQFSQLRDKLKIIAQTATLLVDADTLLKIPLEHKGVETEEYKTIARQLNRIKEVNPSLKYIYTMAGTKEAGIWQFIVDPSTIFQDKKHKGLPSYPGDKYDATRFPEMMKAFDGPSADTQLGTDEWGVTLSGYAPIRDRNGNTVAILGVDIWAKDVYIIQEEVRRRALIVLLLCLALSIIIGISVSRRINRPINKLVEGTRYIAQGDLNYRVPVNGDDEIGELAASFNEMAKSLAESREKLHNYFYNVVQSLVRILEARDPYTKGHSERVAEYAKMVALEMHLPDKQVELIRETAELHDIGKLGIQESILNKQGKLTEEEWETIRKHPLIGENILKPVLLSSEMADMIREHHERYDGKGYPDKLKGSKISTFAQVISVADTWDAMTTARAYRPAMSKEKAMEELRKASGTQFDPEVVDLFLRVMEKE